MTTMWERKSGLMERPGTQAPDDKEHVHGLGAVSIRAIAAVPPAWDRLSFSRGERTG